MTKEQLENLFNIHFTDFEVDSLNAMIDAWRKGERLICYPARRSNKNKLKLCFDTYIALESGIKVNQVYFDEFIGGRDEN